MIPYFHATHIAAEWLGRDFRAFTTCSFPPHISLYVEYNRLSRAVARSTRGSIFGILGNSCNQSGIALKEALCLWIGEICQHFLANILESKGLFLVGRHSHTGRSLFFPFWFLIPFTFCMHLKILLLFAVLKMKHSGKPRHLHFGKCLFIIRVLTLKCGGRKGSMAEEFNPAYSKLLQMGRKWPLQTRVCICLDSTASGILQLLDRFNRTQPERTVSPECRAQIVARLPFFILLLCPCRTDTSVVLET